LINLINGDVSVSLIVNQLNLGNNTKLITNTKTARGGGDHVVNPKIFDSYATK
jgi:hypothetical protein